MLLSYFLFSIFLFQAFYNFSKKLTCLLFLEALTILVLFFSFHFFNQMSSSLSGVCLIMVCMMVLDSVFGLCLLVTFSRNDNNLNFFFDDM